MKPMPKRGWSENAPDCVPDNRDDRCKFCKEKFTQKSVQITHEKQCQEKAVVGQTDVTAPLLNEQSGQAIPENDSVEDLAAVNSPLSPKNEEACEDSFCELIPLRETESTVPGQHYPADRDRQEQKAISGQFEETRKRKLAPYDESWTPQSPPLQLQPLPAGNKLQDHKKVQLLTPSSKTPQLLPFDCKIKIKREQSPDIPQEPAASRDDEVTQQQLDNSIEEMKNLQELLKAQLAYSSKKGGTRAKKSTPYVSESLTTRQLKSEVQELRQKLERATQEGKQMENKCLQLEKKVQSLSSSFTSLQKNEARKKLKATIKELKRKLKKASEESQKMEDNRRECNSEIRQLLGEKEELRSENIQLENELQLVSSSLAEMKTQQDSESRRTRELEAGTKDLRIKLDEATEESRTAMEENRKMKDDLLESDSKQIQLQAEVQKLRKELERSEEEKKWMEECRQMEDDRSQLEKKVQTLSSSLATLQDSESRRTQELQAEIQGLHRKLEKATKESSRMGDESCESDAGNRLLLAENEELRSETLDLKKKMKLLAYSLASLKESEARRVRELRWEIEKAAEESEQSLEECRQLVMEQLADSPEGDRAQSEEAASSTGEFA